MPKPTPEFQTHITKKSKKAGWLVFVVLFGVPIGGSGFAYWFQLEDQRLVKSVRERDALAPYAAWALGHKGQAREAREELQALVGDTSVSSYLRRGAASALGTLKDPSVTPYLDEVVRNDPDADVRGAALDALAVSETLNAGASVQYALANETESIPLAAACHAAGELGLETQIEILIETLETPNYRVRSAAGAALRKLVPEGEAFGDDLERWRTWFSDSDR